MTTVTHKDCVERGGVDAEKFASAITNLSKYRYTPQLVPCINCVGDTTEIAC